MEEGISLDDKDYIKIQELGRGSFGKVLLVMHNILKKRIAIKFIIAEDNDESIKKLVNEVKNHYACNNENVVKCLGYRL